MNHLKIFTVVRKKTKWRGRGRKVKYIYIYIYRITKVTHSQMQLKHELTNRVRFEHFYHKIQCVMNISFVYRGWVRGAMGGEEEETREFIAKFNLFSHFYLKNQCPMNLNKSLLSLGRTSAGIYRCFLGVFLGHYLFLESFVQFYPVN